MPTGLKSFLYAQFVRRGRKLIVGPNVTPLPIRRIDSPGKIELGLMCDCWFEASMYRRDYVIKCTGVEAVRCIHHAIDSEKFNPKHRSIDIWDEYGIPKHSIKILYVGHDRLPRKGVERLIDAIEYIQTQGFDEKLHFIFVGTLPVNGKRIQGLQNTHFLGFKQGDELATIFASVDISVVPSSWENMPFVVLEAMASGLPVIASRTGGIPEQLMSGESGLLVDIVEENGDYRDDASKILAEGILKLVESPALRSQLGQNARRRIVEYFNEVRLGAELSDIFYELAN